MMSPLWLGYLCVCAGVAGGPELQLDRTRQLFLDDHLIESMQNVDRKVQPATKYAGNPVLRKTESYETNVNIVYGSVLHDQDRYRMWYITGGAVAYAESDDGVVWHKPKMDIVTVDGQPTNLLLRKTGDGSIPYFYEMFGVFKDQQDQDPARRYKMGFLSLDPNYTGPRGARFHDGQRRGLGVAGSPDGLRWTLIENWATEAICDGATHWMFDPARGSYVLYGRTKHTPDDVQAAWSAFDWYNSWHWGRAVARIESPDFLHWDHTEPASAPVVMAADLADPPGTEIYSMLVFPYEGVYIGLVQTFLCRPDAATLEIQLAVSRDGVRFTRVADRSPFIPRGPVGSWDRFNLSLATNPPLAVGDELRFYYGGRSYRHNPYAGPDKGESFGGVGLATVLRDRFVSLEASFDGGTVITRPLRIAGTELYVNADSDFGQIVVEVLNGEGQVAAVSDPVVGDAVKLPVRWESGELPVNEPVRLRFTLRNARLFAVWAE